MNLFRPNENKDGYLEKRNETLVKALTIIGWATILLIFGLTSKTLCLTEYH